MAYSNPYRYCNRAAIDGATLKPDHVLVPVWLQPGSEIPAQYSENLITWHKAGLSFLIGFMQQPIECFTPYMKAFWKEIRSYINDHVVGRCVLGYRNDGTPIICPKSRHCTGCPEKYDHDHYNPVRDNVQTISLDYAFEDEEFDYVDPNAVDPLQYVIDQDTETDDDLRARALAYLEKKNARHAQVIRLELDGLDVDDICIAIHLKPSRGREVINEANDELCRYLKMPHMLSKNRRKK